MRVGKDAKSGRQVQMWYYQHTVTTYYGTCNFSKFYAAAIQLLQKPQTGNAKNSEDDDNNNYD